MTYLSKDAMSELLNGYGDRRMGTPELRLRLRQIIWAANFASNTLTGGPLTQKYSEAVPYARRSAHRIALISFNPILELLRGVSEVDEPYNSNSYQGARKVALGLKSHEVKLINFVFGKTFTTLVETCSPNALLGSLRSFTDAVVFENEPTDRLFDLISDVLEDAENNIPTTSFESLRRFGETTRIIGSKMIEIPQLRENLRVMAEAVNLEYADVYTEWLLKDVEETN